MSLEWPDLIHQVAHEVRSQVRKGLSNAQFLERMLGPEADEAVREHLRSIVESQTDLNQLFLRLILLADAQAPAKPRSTRADERLTLETAVLGAKLECREALRREEAELVVRALPECEVPQKIQIVLRELIDNSLRYRDPERPLRIAIDAEQDESRVQVRVSDNGSGIEEAYADRLFQPFQRLDGHRSGFGLGLAIAREIIAAQGGKLYTEPAGQGATFVFELPIPG